LPTRRMRATDRPATPWRVGPPDRYQRSRSRLSARGGFLPKSCEIRTRICVTARAPLLLPDPSLGSIQRGDGPGSERGRIFNQRARLSPRCRKHLRRGNAFSVRPAWMSPGRTPEGGRGRSNVGPPGGMTIPQPHPGVRATLPPAGGGGFRAAMLLLVIDCSGRNAAAPSECVPAAISSSCH
jgi:hypothetical protein